MKGNTCNWFKKLFGLKKNCCCSHHEDEKDVKDINATENTPAESTDNIGDSNEASTVISEESVIKTTEEKKETLEQK